MYQHSLRAYNEYDAPELIPGFAPQTDTMNDGAGGGGNGSGINWGDIIQTVLNDVTQIIKPNTPSTHPLYTPTSTALGKTNLLPIVLIGGAAFLLLSRRR